MTILERSERSRASQALQDKLASRDDMQVFTQTVVQEFRGDAKLSSIVAKDLARGDTREMHPGAVFVFVGLRPNTDFLKGVIEMDENGFIVTGSNLETSRPGIFAAGDCRTGSTK